MSSEKRSEAARANGAKSHGPKTPEGKSRSSQNATRHGLLSDVVVLPGESLEGFDTQVNSYLARFSPVDDFERDMIEEMAASYWRMRRAWAIERNMMAKAIGRQPAGDDPVSPLAGAFCELADSGRLPLLHRYESRLHQMYQRAVRTLLLTRSAAPRLPESIPPAAEPDILTPDPAPDLPAPRPVSTPARSSLSGESGLQAVIPDSPPVIQPAASATQDREIPNEPKKPPVSLTLPPRCPNWAQIYTLPNPEASTSCTPPVPRPEACPEPSLKAPNEPKSPPASITRQPSTERYPEIVRIGYGR